MNLILHLCVIILFIHTITYQCVLSAHEHTKSAFNSDNTRFMNPKQTTISNPFYIVTWNPSGSLLYLLSPQGMKSGSSLTTVLSINPLDNKACQNLNLNSIDHQFVRWIDWPSPHHYLLGVEELVASFVTLQSFSIPIYTHYLATRTSSSNITNLPVLHLIADAQAVIGEPPIFYPSIPYKSNIQPWWGLNGTSTNIVPVSAHLMGVQSMQLIQTGFLDSTQLFTLHVSVLSGLMSLQPLTIQSPFWTFLSSNSNICIYLSCIQSGGIWNDPISSCIR